MKKYTYSGYTLTMRQTDKRDSTGHILVKYSLTDDKHRVLFEGDDFGASPMHSPESKESACALIDFLTLKPGDTDSEYFKDYTPEQMTFATGPAEYLGYDWRLHLKDPDLMRD